MTSDKIAVAWQGSLSREQLDIIADDLELGIDYLSETDVSQWIEASIMQRLNERASQ